MGRGRRLAGFAVLAAVVLLSAPAAYGATAAQIRADLADGQLDGKYTNAELKAFLQDATAQGYAPPGGDVIGNAGVPANVAGEAAGAAGLLPFTGVDLALLVAGAMVLVLIGLGLRRLAANNNN
jgi:hypothetical protein